MSLEAIDKQLKATEVSQRKKFLIKQLHNLDIYQTSDGRKLEDLSLYTLEWLHVEERNKAAKAYAEK
ncbi:Fur-regulated basic protein FbpA [Ornithinibacillus sp. JPR2-1]|uniref:Fur-regulated basic protein FbpA n=1 Tax=Ornithinibacillus sp. JPR2-1 TaxID=2094019 RepID=UPI0031D23E1F